MRKLLILVVVLTLLSASAMAYEVPTDFSDTTLEAEMQAYMDEQSLSADNFSVSYYNTVTGESYTFNDQTIMVAASTYKVPLNMYFYELLQAGSIDDDYFLRFGSQSMRELQKASIIHSDNAAAEILIHYFSEFHTYREEMQKYISAENANFNQLYYEGSNYSTAMMMDILKYLYENAETFEELIQDMKSTTQKGYFHAGAAGYEVAHKYGALLNSHNDVGIIYTPQPYLLAVYSYSNYGEQHCKNIAEIMTAYTVWQAVQQEIPAEEEVPVEVEVPVEQEQPQESEPVEETQTVETEQLQDIPEEQTGEIREEQQPEKKMGLVERMRASSFPWWILVFPAVLLLFFLIRFL